MKLTLLCNAGLALEQDGELLLVDLPNEELPPFYALPEHTWQAILEKEPPYDRVCGLYFTHDHPDHCHREKVSKYLERYPGTPCFFPAENPPAGRIVMGPFTMEYAPMPHAPLPVLPVHAATVVEAGGKQLYLPADSALDCDAHRAFLRGRRVDAAVWTPMYLSRPDTRQLLQDAAGHNYIYHMPEGSADDQGYWKKLERNFQRYGDQLQQVTVLGAYPTTVVI